MATWVRLLLVAVVGVSVGCGSASDVPRPAAPGDSASVIYVVEHGWHAGIVVGSDAASAAQWPVAADFPAARYLEVGWGEARYYPADDPGLGAMLRAGLWPTASVLHVAAFQRPPSEVFPRREIIRIAVSDEGRSALMTWIIGMHARDSTGQVIPAGPGLYSRSRFYKAKPRYHAFSNCNTWAAKALREVGCTMAPSRALTVGALMRQARDCGTVVQAEGSPDE